MLSLTAVDLRDAPPFVLGQPGPLDRCLPSGARGYSKVGQRSSSRCVCAGWMPAVAPATLLSSTAICVRSCGGQEPGASKSSRWQKPGKSHRRRATGGASLLPPRHPQRLAFAFTSSLLSYRTPLADVLRFSLHRLSALDIRNGQASDCHMSIPRPFLGCSRLVLLP